MVRYLAYARNAETDLKEITTVPEPEKKYPKLSAL